MTANTDDHAKIRAEFKKADDDLDDLIDGVSSDLNTLKWGTVAGLSVSIIGLGASVATVEG